MSEERPVKEYGWEELYVAMGVRQNYPIQKMVAYVEKELLSQAGENYDWSFDFSGIEQMTDCVIATFVNTLKEKTTYITKICLNGCIYITDYGIRCLVRQCVNLTEIELDGCRNLTEKALIHINLYCPDIKKISMKATRVGHIPHKNMENVELNLDGCPLYDPTREVWENGTREILDHTIQKMIVLTSRLNYHYSVLNFLADGCFEVSDDKNWSNKYMRDYVLPKSALKENQRGVHFNIFESDFDERFDIKQPAYLSSLISPESVVVIGVDPEEVEGQFNNAQYKLMMKYEAIRGQMVHAPIVFIAFHRHGETDAETEHRKNQSIILANYLNSHVLQAHQESLNKEVTTWLEKHYATADFDFKFQQERSRQDHVHQSRSVICFLFIDMDTQEMELYNLNDSLDSEDPEKKKKDQIAKFENAAKKWAEESHELALSRLSDLSKSDITELKSFSSPPLAVAHVMECICKIFRIKPGKGRNNQEDYWSSSKRFLSDFRFIGNLKDFDFEELAKVKENHWEDIGKFLDTYTIDQLTRVSNAGAAFYLWVKSVYSFQTEVLPLKNALNDTGSEDKTLKLAGSGKGLDYFLDVLARASMSAISTNHQQGVRPSKELHYIYQNCPNKKICSLQEFVDLLPEKVLGNDLDVYEAAVARLHILGRLLFFPEVPGKPVVLDVQWYMDVVSELEKCPQSSYNFLTYDKGILEEDLMKFWDGKVESDQFPVLLSVLKTQGILLEIPCVRKSVSDPPYLLKSHETLPAKFLIGQRSRFREELKSENQEMTQNALANNEFQSEHWIGRKSDQFRAGTDLEIGVVYSFLAGMPSNLLPKIMADFYRSGHVVMAYHDGLLLEHGAVSILMRMAVQGSLITSTLNVNARSTCPVRNKPGVPSKEKRKVVEYMWSVLNYYLLGVEYHINSYPDLQVKVGICCQGGAVRGSAYTYSPAEVTQSLRAQHECPECKTSLNEVEAHSILGYKHMPLPGVHDWLLQECSYMSFGTGKGSFNPMNTLCTWCRTCASRGPECKDSVMLEGMSSDQCTAPGWTCRICGICRRCSHMFWKMQTSLYPSFLTRATEHQDHDSRLRGNLVDMTKKTKNDETNWRFNLPLNMGATKLFELSIIVLKEGPIAVEIKDLQTKPRMCISLATGEIADHLSDGEIKEEATISTIPQLQCQSGDIFQLRVIRDFSEKYGNEQAIMNEMGVYKNSQLLHTFVMTSRDLVTIVSEGTETEPFPETKFILSMPSLPLVQARNVPLGSIVLLKTGKQLLQNEWKVCQVEKIANDQLYLYHEENGKEVEVAVYADSDDILPVVREPGDMKIMLGRSPLGKTDSDRLFKHFDSVGYFPAPMGVFLKWYKKKQSTIPLRPVRVHGLVAYSCTTPIFHPSVLARTFRGFVHQVPKTLELLKKPIIFMTPSKSRQHLHNWETQQIVFLCTGNLQQLTYSDGARAKDGYHDYHFMNVAPKPVDKETAIDLMRQCCISMAYTYNTLLSGKINPPKVLGWDIDGHTDEMLAYDIASTFQSYRDTMLLFAYITGKSDSLVMRKGPNFFSTPAGKKLVEEWSPHFTQSSEKPPLFVCRSHRAIVELKERDDLALTPGEEDNPYGGHLGIFAAVGDLKLNIQENLSQYYPNLTLLMMQDSELQNLNGIGSCKHLQYLFLARNIITELSPDLSQLQDTLRVLIMPSNPLAELPDFLCNFRKLIELDVSNTLLHKLPDEIGKLASLQVLKMNATHVDSLPPSFKDLSCLRMLMFQGLPWYLTYKPPSTNINAKTLLNREEFLLGYMQQGITARVMLPGKEEQERNAAWFDQCDTDGTGTLSVPQIRELNKFLRNEYPRLRLKDDDDPYGGIPPEIFSCHQLQNIDFSFQCFAQVPDAVGRLQRLRFLNLSHNPWLKTISGEVGKTRLEVLNLAGCSHLSTPPREIIEHGMAKTIAYLRRLATGSVACYRTKLMFVGLGGAGKTSLLRSLMSVDNKAPINQGEAITDGIDISNWSIKRAGKTITFSVWDFAGQTLYYNTHQFFLSSRAVYVLVWNTRLGHEHAGLEFWLSSIRSHAPKAPVFIVGTHADKVSKSELPVEEFSRRFPSIVGFYAVSSLTGQNIEKLQEHLLAATLEQRYIGERIPEVWLNLEKAIVSRRGSESVLDWVDVVKMAQNVGIYDYEAKEAVRFLHDLGSLQHFDNAFLRDKVVVNPQWIVDVMACVVSVHNQVVKNGRLAHSDIGVIWKDYPVYIHNWLLRLTEVFDLTFPLTTEEVNIVPCLLPSKEPEYDWPELDENSEEREMKMIYQFEYLPAGLFNRLQVRLCEFSDSTTMWKLGSILKKNDHRALVSQTGASDVLVRVHGVRPENVLLLVHEVVEDLINESFQGVKYDYMLPCMDCARSTSNEQAMFSSRVLHRAIEMKALFLQCHKYFHTLSISEVQTTMPPDSSGNFDLHLQKTMNELESMSEKFQFDVFLLYCDMDVPVPGDDTVIHPNKINTDLRDAGFTCWYRENMESIAIEELIAGVEDSRVIVVFISLEFTRSANCQRIFRYAMDTRHKPIILLNIKQDREWQSTDIGMQVAEKVYINFARMDSYNENMKELIERLEIKTGKKQTGDTVFESDIFVSYCWCNSASAVEAGQARAKDGSLGAGDPREIKKQLENAGFKCWLDVEQVGETGLFDGIAEGLKHCKVVVACVSDDYAQSANCGMEFRFAHAILRKPIILAVVGTGFKWESTSVGMLSLGYPKISFQGASNTSFDQLLTEVHEQLKKVSTENSSVANPEKPSSAKKGLSTSAFEELYELAQRKFLRQITSYINEQDGFPRLFVIDVKDGGDQREPESPTESTEDSGKPSTEAEADETKEPSDKENDITNGDTPNEIEYCFRLLCEHEGGWHPCEASLPAPVYNDTDLELFWQLSAPYLGRIMAVLKYSSMDMKILQMKEGTQLLKNLEKHVGIDVDISSIYTALRQHIMSMDTDRTKGGLKLCHLPSGRTLWLCSAHRNSSRITVIDVDTTMPLGQEPLSSSDLLAALSTGPETSPEDEPGKLETFSRPSTANKKSITATPKSKPGDKKPKPVSKQPKNAGVMSSDTNGDVQAANRNEWKKLRMRVMAANQLGKTSQACVLL